MFKALILILLSVIVILAGCEQIITPPPDKSGGTGGTAPSIPLKVNLSLSKAPALNESAELTCTVTVVFDAPNTTIEIKLPEGFVLLGGNLFWSGNIPKNGKVELKATVKAVKVGNWVIEAKAGYPLGKDSWIGEVDRIYIFVLENSASMSKIPFPGPGPEERRR